MPVIGEAEGDAPSFGAGAEIEHHFFALAPWVQVERITAFYHVMAWRNPKMMPYDLVLALRLALGDMTERTKPPLRVQTTPDKRVEVLAKRYHLVLWPGGSHVRFTGGEE